MNTPTKGDTVSIAVENGYSAEDIAYQVASVMSMADLQQARHDRGYSQSQLAAMAHACIVMDVPMVIPDAVPLPVRSPAETQAVSRVRDRITDALDTNHLAEAKLLDDQYKRFLSTVNRRAYGRKAKALMINAKKATSEYERGELICAFALAGYAAATA